MQRATMENNPDLHCGNGLVRISAAGKSYRQLNEEIRATIANAVGGRLCIELDEVMGHRYIGCGLGDNVRICINGTPGNDLAAFMDGAEIVVDANVQDATGNTMNGGRIVVHGDAGDVAAHSMRGGTILVRGNVGYRCGIHMKSFQQKRPVVIVGGIAGQYLGEYMAGGLLIVLGLEKSPETPISGIYTGTGMHGGKIILGDDIAPSRLGKEVGKSQLDDADKAELRQYVSEYVAAFGGDVEKIMARSYVKLLPVSRRPYGQIYVY